MRNASQNTRRKGFTLIELMIVVAIIAIIAAIAYPNYTRYAFRTRRADAHEMMMRIAAMQERHYTNRNEYGTAADLGLDSTASEKGYYQIAINRANGNQTYVLTATPAGAQVGDKCGNLTINNIGNKGQSGDETNGRCW
jgi:type IV pilus assembly protein PilE